MSEVKKAFMTIQADEELKEKTRQRAGRQRKRIVRAGWQPVVAALVALALFGGGFGYHTLTAEAAYVSVETAGATEEPGIGLSINRWGNVIRAEGTNEAGKDILSKTDVTGMRYEDALQTVLEAAEDFGYMKEDTQIDFAVCAGAETELVKELQGTSQTVVEAICPYANTGCGWASTQVRENANGYGMSCNRYQLAEEIMKLDETVTMEACSKYTLHQLYCWYQALCDGETVPSEEVPKVCTQYGCGIRGNAGGGGVGQNNAGGSNVGQGNGHQGQGHRGGRWK